MKKYNECFGTLTSNPGLIYFRPFKLNSKAENLLLVLILPVSAMWLFIRHAWLCACPIYLLSCCNWDGQSIGAQPKEKVAKLLSTESLFLVGLLKVANHQILFRLLLHWALLTKPELWSQLLKRKTMWSKVLFFPAIPPSPLLLFISW